MIRASHAFAVISLAGLASIAGCGYTEMHEVVLRAPSPPSGRAVEVYMVGQSPSRPFYEVALLQVIGHGTDANLEETVKSLTVRASSLGCDAIVRIAVDQGYSIAHGFGVCVRWAEVAVPAAAAPPVVAPPVAPPSGAPPAQL